MRWPIKPNDSKGLALIVTILFIAMFTITAGFALSAAVNQKAATDTEVGFRLKNYYKVQAGLVDARERIYRNDATSAPALVPAGSFTNPSYDPNEYRLNIDGQGDDDVKIDIGAEDGTTKLRRITVTSMGN